MRGSHGHGSTLITKVADDLTIIGRDLEQLVDALAAAQRECMVISSNSETLDKSQQVCAETSAKIGSEIRHAAASLDRVARLLSRQYHSLSHCEYLIDGAVTVTRDLATQQYGSHTLPRPGAIRRLNLADLAASTPHESDPTTAKTPLHIVRRDPPVVLEHMQPSLTVTSEA